MPATTHPPMPRSLAPDPLLPYVLSPLESSLTSLVVSSVLIASHIYRGPHRESQSQCYFYPLPVPIIQHIGRPEAYLLDNLLHLRMQRLPPSLCVGVSSASASASASHYFDDPQSDVIPVTSSGAVATIRVKMMSFTFCIMPAKSWSSPIIQQRSTLFLVPRPSPACNTSKAE